MSFFLLNSFCFFFFFPLTNKANDKILVIIIITQTNILLYKLSSKSTFPFKVPLDKTNILHLKLVPLHRSRQIPKLKIKIKLLKLMQLAWRNVSPQMNHSMKIYYFFKHHKFNFNFTKSAKTNPTIFLPSPMNQTQVKYFFSSN